MLTISLSNQTGFIGLYLAVCASFSLENLFTPYGFYPLGWVNQCPYIIDLHGIKFGFHDFKPFIGVRPLYCIHISDRILVVLIEFNRILIPDQKI